MGMWGAALIIAGACFGIAFTGAYIAFEAADDGCVDWNKTHQLCMQEK